MFLIIYFLQIFVIHFSHAIRSTVCNLSIFSLIWNHHIIIRWIGNDKHSGYYCGWWSKVRKWWWKKSRSKWWAAWCLDWRIPWKPSKWWYYHVRSWLYRFEPNTYRPCSLFLHDSHSFRQFCSTKYAYISWYSMVRCNHVIMTIVYGISFKAKS